MATRSLITIAIDTSAGHSDADIKDLIHRIPGTHMLDSAELGADLTDFEWDDGDNLPAMPMTVDDASELMDDNGYLTVVLAIDKDSYLEHHAYSSTEGADTHEDLVHSAVFDFGLPHDSTTEILAVQGDDFIVSYTTYVAEHL